MKYFSILFISLLLFSCKDKEEVIQKYDNGKKKVTVEILKGTKEKPVEVNYKAYFDNGQVFKEGLMKEGKEHGEWKYYYRSGKTSSIGSFDGGVPSGKFKRFYETGEVEQEGEYTSGEISSSAFYYRNGKPKKEPLDASMFMSNTPAAWSEEQKTSIADRCNQVLQFDYQNSNQFCKCITDSVSRHVEFAVIDTLSDFDKSQVYQVFMLNGGCQGLFY